MPRFVLPRIEIGLWRDLQQAIAALFPPIYLCCNRRVGHRLTSTVEVPPPHTCRHGGAILSGPIAENNRAIFQSWPHGTGLD